MLKQYTFLFQLFIHDMLQQDHLIFGIYIVEFLVLHSICVFHCSILLSIIEK
jgi:hypothetical protein